jgi:transposase-like protein
MLAKMGQLTAAQRRKVLAALQEPQAAAEAAAVAQGRLSQRPGCPHCRAEHVVRHGQASGLQRYQCRQCRRTFNALTGTPLARLRHKAKWLQQSDALLLGLTIRQASERLQVAPSTAFRWRHRFLALPQNLKPGAMSGVVEVDETYVRRSCKGQRVLGRVSRRRGGAAPKRGVSKEHLPVLVACERAGATTDYMLEDGDKPEVCRALGPVLAADTIVCTDGSFMLAAAFKDLALEHRPISRTQGRRVRGPWHLQNVNAYHGRFKQWLSRFRGVATSYLGRYLGWFRALDRPARHPSGPTQMLALAVGA